MSSMKCKECGATFTPYKADQLFCCAAHGSKYHQRAYRRRSQVKHEAALLVSTELDILKEQNGALQKENEELKIQNEQWKESVRKYHRRVEQLEELIEKRDDTIISQKKEIEQLKDQQKTKRTSDFKREHLERVLTSEIKRQFPNDTIIQTHVEAIRSFNASYINTLVTA